MIGTLAIPLQCVRLILNCGGMRRLPSKISLHLFNKLDESEACEALQKLIYSKLFEFELKFSIVEASTMKIYKFLAGAGDHGPPIDKYFVSFSTSFGIEQSRVEQSRVEQSRVEQSRVEQSRVEHSAVHQDKKQRV